MTEGADGDPIRREDNDARERDIDNEARICS